MYSHSVIITRTPFRISFFGGGTDYPVWYEKHGGMVLSTTINKYCYITTRYLPPFFDHAHHIRYAINERAQHVHEIQHPVVRESLKFFNIEHGVEIVHTSDIPALSGVGSSSSFTVGLVHALHALVGKTVTKRQLALNAMHIEQNLIRESVGSQDQTAAAFGGFNKIEFGGTQKILVTPITLGREKTEKLERNFMLFFTGISRQAHTIAQEQVERTPDRAAELRAMTGIAYEALDVLNNDSGFDEFGQLLHEAWMLKRSLTTKISNTTIDEIYAAGRAAGALGGKLLGAGGGGFMLFYVRPEDQLRVKEALKHLLYVPFKFEDLGSQIIYYAPHVPQTI